MRFKIKDAIYGTIAMLTLLLLFLGWEIFEGWGITRFPRFLWEMKFLLLFMWGTLILLSYATREVCRLLRGARDGSCIDIWAEVGLPVKREVVTLMHTENALRIYNQGRIDEEHLLKELPYENIVDICEYTEREIIEKKKSTVGRMVLGGFIAGDAGLVLGYLDSQNPKLKNKVTNFLLLHYRNYRNCDAVSSMLFVIDSNHTWGLFGFKERFYAKGVKQGRV